MRGRKTGQANPPLVQQEKQKAITVQEVARDQWRQVGPEKKHGDLSHTSCDILDWFFHHSELRLSYL